jgi:hypothetical protein
MAKKNKRDDSESAAVTECNKTLNPRRRVSRQHHTSAADDERLTSDESRFLR